jgi:hypothetical protein
MKVSEFLKSINGNLKLELPEDVLAKLDIDLPETFDARFSEVYLTKERAMSDDTVISEITKKSNKAAFTAIDEQVKELLTFVSDEDKQKINSVFSTAEKVKLLKPALDVALTKVKGKATQEDVRKVEEEWSGKVAAIQATAKAEKEALAKNLQDQQFDFYVANKLSGYNVTKEFTPMRDKINQMALIDLRSKGYRYEFENGVVAVRQEKDGVVRDVFNGDKKVTLENLLDGFIDPFIAKSPDTTTQQQQQNKKVVAALGPNATLYERMQFEAATNTI